MKKRPVAFLLLLCLLLGCLPTASADVGALDRALTRWLSAYPAVRFNATLELTALQPFGEPTVAMLASALSHLTLAGELSQSGDASVTGAQVSLGDTELFRFTESEAGGAYTFTTSLLPGRTLTSATLDPFTLLAGAQEAAQTAEAAEAAAPDTAAPEAAEPDAAAPDATAPDAAAPDAAAPDAAATDAAPPEAAAAVNGVDIADAYSALDAITELNACYKALTDGITPLTEEKRANYNIKGIGAGRWSRVARLTPEQSEALLPQLRAVLACGMDAAYRAEVAQMTFDRGFVVALYQNTDKQDICLYLKGTVIYPDGDRRKLLFQWAFTTNGITRKDTVKYEVARQSGTLDSRLIAATYTLESRSDAYLIDGKTETTLRRAKVTEKCTARVNLTGTQDAALVMTCDGTVSQELATTVGSDTQRETEKADVALRLTPDSQGALLAGTVGYTALKEKAVQAAFTLTLADGAATPGEAAAAPAADGQGNALSDLDAIAGLFANTGTESDAASAAAAAAEAAAATAIVAATETPAPGAVANAAAATATVTPTETPAPGAAANAAAATVTATETPVPGAAASATNVPDGAAMAGDMAGQPDTGADATGAEAAAPDATTAAGQTDYLVGSAPIGLQEYHPSQGMTTIALDGVTPAQRLALFQEAAQNLATRLVLGLAGLPQADAAILYDSLTDQDAAALTALLKALQ